MKTPRADHYRKEFARRKESSDLIRWMLDEFEQTERRLYESEEIIKRFVNVTTRQGRSDSSSPESIMKGRD